MRVIFGRNKKLGSLILQAYMGCKYSHVGILIDSNTVLEAWGQGVTLTPIREFLARYDEYEVRTIYTTRANKPKALAQLGKPYDYKGLFGIFFSKRAWNDEERWFCSELAGLYSGLFTEEYSGHVDVKHIYMISHKDKK